MIEIYEKVVRDEQNKPQYHFVILDYACEFVEGTARASGDATDAAWVSEQELDALSLTTAAKRVIRKAFSRVQSRAATSR